jgi:hypothetical protein
MVKKSENNRLSPKDSALVKEKREVNSQNDD